MKFDLYPWQKECFDNISNKDAIISSPTGSGKTLCSFLWASILDSDGNVQSPESKTIFTAPIKALSNERYMGLRNMGLDVGIETGDYKFNSDAKIICCTQEIYTLKYSKIPDLNVIIDEFHYVFQEINRSRCYIDGIYQTNDKSKILVMSATFGKPESLKYYLEKLTDRNFTVYTNEERITELNYLKKSIKPKEVKNAIIFVFSKRGIDGISEVVSMERKKIPGEDRTIINEMAKILGVEDVPKSMRLGVGPYCGSMLPKEKLLVERAYRARLIDVVVGTDALALGVNLPAEYVIFGQLAKKDGPIGKNSFLQLSGRAGRKGFFDKGYVSYLGLKDNQWESRGYQTSSLYSSLLKAECEVPTISILPKLGDIISGITTQDEEAEFVSKYSLPKIQKKIVNSKITEDIENLNELIETYSGNCDYIKNKIKNNIGLYWDSSIDMENNVKISYLLCSFEKIDIFDLIDIFDQEEKNDLNGLLRAKCFVKCFNLENMFFNFEQIDIEIMSIDETVFTFEEKNKEIDDLLSKREK